MNNLSSLFYCNRSSVIQNVCAKALKSPVTVITTGIALAAIATFVVGMLAHYEVIVGLNSMTQWSLISAGACVTLIATVAVTLRCFSVKRHIDEQTPLSLENLEERLEAIIDSEEDLLTEIYRLAETLPLENLQGWLKEKVSPCPDILSTAKRSVKQAQCYLEIRDTPSLSARTHLRSLCDILLSTIDSILLGFGIGEFFSASESKIDGEFKFQKIMMLVSFFTLLTSTLLPMLGVTTGASTVGAILLTIALVSIIWPRIRPLLPTIPEGENWSKQLREGKLRPIGGRKNAIKKIAQTLINQRHPLLIGRSGIGKTQTVQAFVQALERGDFPELSGKTVFYFNTANLVANKELFGGGNKVLKRIGEAMGPHRNNCILVLDEIQLAFQKNKSAIGEQLKTLLDDKEGNFPYVIGLTTEEEYYRDIYKNNSAGDRRFEKIKISSTKQGETLAILNQFLIRKAPSAIVERKALKYLIEQTADLPQPLTAQTLLSKCFARTQTYDTPAYTKVEKRRIKLENAYYKEAVLGSASLKSETKQSKKIATLETQLREAEKKLEGEETLFKHLARNKQDLADVRRAKFHALLQITRFEGDRSPQEERMLRLFSLLNYFVEGALESKIREQAEKMHVKAVIDKDLIDEILAEEQESAKKREESLAAGKNALLQRLS